MDYPFGICRGAQICLVLQLDWALVAQGTHRGPGVGEKTRGHDGPPTKGFEMARPAMACMETMGPATMCKARGEIASIKV